MLPILLALLVSGQQESKPRADPLEAGWKGRPVCEKIREDEHLRVLRCTFPPGVGHERHYHRRHFGYALSGGRAQIKDERGVREVDISTGSSFSSDSVEWHEMLNVGSTVIQYLIVEPKQTYNLDQSATGLIAG